MAKIPELGAAWQRAMGDVSDVQRVLAKADASLDALRQQIVAMDEQIRRAKNGAVESLKGVEVLDTTALPGGPFPGGAPIIDVRHGVEHLRKEVYGGAPFIDGSDLVEQLVSKPIHRDVARFVGFPVIKTAPEAGIDGSITRQVGELSGYGTVDEAAFAAMREAAKSNRAVAVLPGATDGGEERFLLGMIDGSASSNLAVNGSERSVPLIYRTEVGEKPAVLGIADRSGAWRNFQKVKGVKVDSFVNSSLRETSELNRSSVAHYAPEAAADIRSMETARAEVQALIDLLQSSTSRSMATVETAKLESGYAAAIARGENVLPPSIPSPHEVGIAVAKEQFYPESKYISELSGVAAILTEVGGDQAALHRIVDVARRNNRSPQDVKVLVIALTERLVGASKSSSRKSRKRRAVEKELEFIERIFSAPAGAERFSALSHTRYSHGTYDGRQFRFIGSPSWREPLQLASQDDVISYLIAGDKLFTDSVRIGNNLIHDRFTTGRSSEAGEKILRSIFDSGRTEEDADQILSIFGALPMNVAADPASRALMSDLSLAEITGIARNISDTPLSRNDLHRFSDDLERAIVGD